MNDNDWLKVECEESVSNFLDVNTAKKAVSSQA